MIDMHIHSTNSDGSETVLEILKQAEKIGLSVISITDHENCNEYDELEKIDWKKYFSGKIIKGIELKSRYKKTVMDILGYGYDPVKMKKYLAEVYKDSSKEKIQENQLKEFYEIGKKMGLVLRPIEELKWDHSKEWGSVVFYEEMKSHPENKEKLPPDIWEGDFRNFKVNHYHLEEDIFYIDRAKFYPTVPEILDVIHKSGGKAFIAHIYEYQEFPDKIKELEEIFSKYDIDGVECYYSNFSEEENKLLLEFTGKHHLLRSGGSDFHGENRPSTKIGSGKGNLCVPDEILEDWGII